MILRLTISWLFYLLFGKGDRLGPDLYCNLVVVRWREGETIARKAPMVVIVL